ncbi:MAG: hypothetical protein ACKVW3_04435 [Phycisphaerales bacterium]
MSTATSQALASARSILAIAAITLLIWLLAESESLRVEQVRVEVIFRAAPESERVVRLASGQEFTGSVTLTLEGSNARMDDLIGRFRRPVRLQPGRDTIPLDPGRHVVDLASAIGSIAEVRETHVRIASSEPASVVIDIDSLVTRTATVRVEVPPGAALEGAPEASPSSVRLSIPGAIAKDLPAELVATVRLGADSLSPLPEGRRSTINALVVEPPAVLMGLEQVTIDPPRVSVAVSLRTRTKEITLPTVPVHVRLAPTELGLWDITIPPEGRLLTDVVVRGPSDLIDQIVGEKIRPVAYVALSLDDLERAASSGQPLEQEAVFEDAPGLLRFEAKQRLVRLMVKRRGAPGS